jgi:hypothetical protein
MDTGILIEEWDLVSRARVESELEPKAGRKRGEPERGLDKKLMKSCEKKIPTRCLKFADECRGLKMGLKGSSGSKVVAGRWQ